MVWRLRAGQEAPGHSRGLTRSHQRDEAHVDGVATIRGAIKDSQKAAFRIVEFNVLSNHIHFLAEASGTSELSRGVQGFAGRVARRLNKKLKCTGKLFAARFHARAMTPARDVRNTLRYVLLDRKHHDTTTNFDRYWIDPYSSAAWFDGWAEPIRGASWKHELVARPPPTERAKTWLLGVGWRRYGALRFDERPPTELQSHTHGSQESVR